MENFPVITLSNGLKVVNFNSPHSFTFSDDSILPAVSKDIALATMLDNRDVITDNGKFKTVKKIFALSDSCLNRINKAKNLDCDIIIVPLPVLQLINDNNLNNGKFFTGFIVDRINKILAIDKFCQ